MRHCLAYLAGYATAKQLVERVVANLFYLKQLNCVIIRGGLSAEWDKAESYADHQNYRI